MITKHYKNIVVYVINTYYVYCKSAVLRFSSCSIISDLFQTVSLIRFPLLKDIYKNVNIPFSEEKVRIFYK